MTDETVLATLLKANGLDENEAASLAANVVEWRGGSASQKLEAPSQDDRPFMQIPRATGFNTTTGSATQQTPQQKPSIRYFFHPMQLASVPGLSKALVKTLCPLLTVANGSKQIDPFIASEGVLNALPDASSSKVEAFLSARDGNTSRDTAILLLGVDKELLREDAASGWRLQIVTTRRASRTRRCEAIGAVLKDDIEPYRVLYVVDDQDQYARLTP